MIATILTLSALYLIVRFERCLADILDPYRHISDDTINTADPCPMCGWEGTVVGGVNVAPSPDAI